MKTFIILAPCFVFAIAQVATADDVMANRSVPQRNEHPTTGIRTSTANPGHNQLADHPNPNLWRRHPVFAQPIRSVPLAMNFQARQTPEQPRTSVAAGTLQRANSNRRSYFDALRRCRHERHDCNWWKQHCTTIVFVSTGYYYLDAGYWYPALGYDPAYDYYDYDGPIYTYGNLLPDQVIANVQVALQQAGYYVGPVTGSLGPATRAALANYQRDYGLIITGAIDEPTVVSLGLN
jgi:Putative peptidoglycan binding domain